MFRFIRSMQYMGSNKNRNSYILHIIHNMYFSPCLAIQCHHFSVYENIGTIEYYSALHYCPPNLLIPCFYIKSEEKKNTSRKVCSVGRSFLIKVWGLNFPGNGYVVSHCFSFHKISATVWNLMSP